MSRARRASAAAVLLLVCGVLAGCSRKVDFSALRGRHPDTEAVDDTTLALARDTQARWDAGSGDDAAQLNARLLAHDLASHDADHWAARARFVLDSLAFGADIGDAPGVLLVNFFNRADPDQGAWPYLFWQVDRKLRQQALDGRGLHLDAVVSRGMAAGDTRPSAIAALFGKRAAGGQQPLLMIWTRPPKDDAWTLAQTLGADSLGAMGSGDFVVRDTSVELVTHTYQGTRGYEECASCPHVYRNRHFAWGPNGFAETAEAEVPSPYVSFVHFTQALSLDDYSLAARWAVDPSLVDRARRLEWGSGTRGSWRLAPDTDENATEMVYFRGKEEAYRVQFTQRGTEWLIQNFDVTTRSVE
jgi:hypothetical protein